MNEETQWKDRAWYARELHSEGCICGRPKRRGYSFCYPCYKALPPDMQRDLYQKIGAGYEEAYEDAVGWLEAWEGLQDERKGGPTQ